MLLPTALTQAPSSHLERLRRLAGPLLRPLPLLAAAGGTLVLLGGAAAIIVGCCALLLALDRAFPVGGAALPQAEHSFRRLVRARRREMFLRRLRGRACTEQRLLCLSEDRGWIALAERRHLGVQAIAVDSIIGTVEGNKADAFDSRFRPPRWSRGRWTQIWQAAQRGTELPPISVYRVGNRHFVRDGHHRVSVAAALATGDIEADVVELHPARPTSATSDVFDGYRRQFDPARKEGSRVANFKQRLNERRAARRARKLKRRRERDEAISEREPRARRRYGPSPSEVYTRGFKDTKP